MDTGSKSCTSHRVLGGFVEAMLSVPHEAVLHRVGGENVEGRFTSYIFLEAFDHSSVHPKNQGRENSKQCLKYYKQQY